MSDGQTCDVSQRGMTVPIDRELEMPRCNDRSG